MTSSPHSQTRGAEQVPLKASPAVPHRLPEVLEYRSRDLKSPVAYHFVTDVETEA